jgi:hypothetical protein
MITGCIILILSLIILIESLIMMAMRHRLIAYESIINILRDRNRALSDEVRSSHRAPNLSNASPD